MRMWAMVALLSLVGCTGLGTEQADIAAASSASPMPQAPSVTPPGGAFAGEWEACEGTTSPEECGRYLLLQSGSRICGTWFYFATGREYTGRIIARADSSTEARRTHVCGRPGSATDTECEEGWQRIDKPLRICNGKLSDLMRADGSCSGYYQAVHMAKDHRDALLAEPWMEDCLSGIPGDAP
ncbi:hypothetical protein IB223_07580 [Pseudoxanthomonas sp. PXM03]|uniref:hypothetical protein n=1 Tax=Pseudoxanthomonas sp. PXM03 TaxID=2769284 RepID=UPI0017838B47|nr:hypothetical protein [Pseudoxanthomonas sp. PXM03]MBD9435947.1 hypothetical protein [Pseudoxanthomonas sp. PXM03]